MLVALAAGLHRATAALLLLVGFGVYALGVEYGDIVGDADATLRWYVVCAIAAYWTVLRSRKGATFGGWFPILGVAALGLFFLMPIIVSALSDRPFSELAVRKMALLFLLSIPRSRLVA